MDPTTAVRGMKTAGEGAPTVLGPVALVPGVGDHGRVPIGRRTGVAARTRIGARVPAGATGGPDPDGPARAASSARPAVVMPAIVMTAPTGAALVRAPAIPIAVAAVEARPPAAAGEWARPGVPGAVATADVPGTRRDATRAATRTIAVPRTAIVGAGGRRTAAASVARPHVRETTGATVARDRTAGTGPGGRTSGAPKVDPPGAHPTADRSVAATAAAGGRATAGPRRVVTTTGRTVAASAAAGPSVPVEPVRRVRTVVARIAGTATARGIGRTPLVTTARVTTVGATMARATATGSARTRGHRAARTSVRVTAAVRRRKAPPHDRTTGVRTGARTGGIGTSAAVETAAATVTAGPGVHLGRTDRRTGTVTVQVRATVGLPGSGPGPARTARHPRTEPSGETGRSRVSVRYVGTGRMLDRLQVSVNVLRTGTARTTPPGLIVRTAPLGPMGRIGLIVRSVGARRPTAGRGPIVARRLGTPVRGASPRRPSRRWFPNRHCRTR